MPTWIERQKERYDKVITKDLEQHQDAIKLKESLAACWKYPPFQVLLTMLDMHFDPERNLNGDEYQRRMAADYWKLRREMEHKHGG